MPAGQPQHGRARAAPAQLAYGQGRKLPACAKGGQKGVRGPDQKRIEGVKYNTLCVLAGSRIALPRQKQVMRAVARRGKPLPKMRKKGRQAARLAQAQPTDQGKAPLHRQNPKKGRCRCQKTGTKGFVQTPLLPRGPAKNAASLCRAKRQRGLTLLAGGARFCTARPAVF